MASTRPQWPDLLDPTFRTIYGKEIKQIPTKYETIFNVFSSKKNLEKDSQATGLSKLTEKTEQGAISFEDEIQGYDTTYTHKTFAKGTGVSLEMWQDDQFNVMNQKPTNLARAKMRTKEQSGADIFNYGFTVGGGGSAQFLSGGDGAALFSSAHTRPDGGTNQSNTTTADLNENSLETALVTMRATLDGKGQLQGINPTTMVVAPALWKEASILLKSTGRVGTANNDINPYEGALELVTWDYLGSAAGGSDTAWFVLDKSFHKLNWFNRYDSGLDGPEYEFDTKVAKWSVLARWSVGFSDWVGTYGSKGDNS